MGWCSGTYIFDTVVGAVYTVVPDDFSRRILIHALVKALEDQDWDCQSDSGYYDDPLVRRVFKEIHPDWDLPENDITGKYHYNIPVIVTDSEVPTYTFSINPEIGKLDTILKMLLEISRKLDVT